MDEDTKLELELMTKEIMRLKQECQRLYGYLERIRDTGDESSRVIALEALGEA